MGCCFNAFCDDRASDQCPENVDSPSEGGKKRNVRIERAATSYIRPVRPKEGGGYIRRRVSEGSDYTRRRVNEGGGYTSRRSGGVGNQMRSNQAVSQ